MPEAQKPDAEWYGTQGVVQTSMKSSNNPKTAADGNLMNESIPESTSKDRRLIAIFLIVLIDILGLTIILPLLPFYSEHLGANATTVGALISVYAACQLIAGPILGHWSDKIGRKPILIVSQIGTCLGFLLMAVAPSLFWLFVARIIDGLTAGNLSTAQAYITDVAEPQNRAKELGQIGIRILDWLLRRTGSHCLSLSIRLSGTHLCCSILVVPQHSRHHISFDE